MEKNKIISWIVIGTLLAADISGLTAIAVTHVQKHREFIETPISDVQWFEEDMGANVFLSQDVSVSSWKQDLQRGIATFDVDANGYSWKVEYGVHTSWIWEFHWKYRRHALWTRG